MAIKISSPLIRRTLSASTGLALILGLAAGTTTTASAGITPACAWTSLTLVNGWQSANATFGTGDPRYCIDGGIVYLSGSLAGGTGSQFATLPSWATPTSRTYLSTYTFGGKPGIIRIETNGTMNAYGGSATSYTSLAGISFPAAAYAPPGQSLSLINDWKSADSVYGSGAPSYIVTNGIVHLSGSMTNPDGNNVNGHFTHELNAIEPDHCTETSVYTLGGSVGLLSISGTTDVGYDVPPLPAWKDDSWIQDTEDSPASGPDVGAFTSLAGVAYPAAGAAWQPLSLINGWANGQENCFNGDPSYYQKGGIVYLSGLVDQSPYGNCAFAVLPAAARPAHTLYLIANAEGLPIADIRISPDGTTCAWSLGGSDNGWDNGGGAGVVASLGGLSYQLSS
jgi:hypothetical protein